MDLKMMTFLRLQENRKHMRAIIGPCSNFHETPQATIATDASPLPTSFVKPENITVSGLVFYGRKSRVSTMRCYLERNMIDNGGWIDEVLWVVNTDKQEDPQYLEEIIASDPMRHKKVTPDELLMTYTCKKAWQLLERGRYYVKIDDDVMRLWIDYGAIPNLVI
ncbi:hypothetical protein NW762_005535 [Fusarium torreyae]|uniref:Uncharacterized protein n=1 Tax=Fusarium torreyae TaxID=1237075 RepID=A0A9W8S2Q9_9HYPO|nr:hypothetical protein NW762_005535 [Fusarium torreyae]